MQLSEFEASTAIWTKVSEKLTERLHVLRKRNDGDLDAIETARLRGSIATLKEILAYGDKPGPEMNIVT